MIKKPIKPILSKRILQNAGLTFALALIVALIFFVHSTLKEKHDLEGILENGRLTVITENSSIGITNIKDSIYGFQYEIIKAFANSLGVELVVTEENDYKKSVDALLNGDCNIIANMAPLTTQWKDEVSFTVPLFTTHQVLVQQQYNPSNPSKYNSKHIDLANDSVYIKVNSPNRMLVEHLSEAIAAPIHIIENKKSDQERMVQLVSMGKIKNTICDYLLAEKLKLKYPNIDTSLAIGFEQSQVWAVNPESTHLTAILNEFLKDFIGSSDYWKIYNKYYK